jgi:cell division transport system permease protein
MATPKMGRGRSIRFSYATTIISMTFVLFLLGAIGFVMANIFTTTKHFRESVTMIVELNDGLTEEDCTLIADRIIGNKLVKSIKFVSKEEKVEDEEFKRTFDVDIKGILGENPLSDSFDVTLSEFSADKASLDEFTEEVRAIEGGSFVSYPERLVEEMHSTLDILQLVLALFGVVLLVVSFILLNNIIRLAVYAQREMINTLKAVGATKWFIMRPFILKSALQGLLAGIFATLLLLAALYGLDKVASDAGLLMEVKWVAHLAVGVVSMGIIVAVLCTIAVVNRFVNMKSNKIHIC